MDVILLICMEMDYVHLSRNGAYMYESIKTMLKSFKIAFQYITKTFSLKIIWILCGNISDMISSSNMKHEQWEWEKNVRKRKKIGLQIEVHCNWYNEVNNQKKWHWSTIRLNLPSTSHNDEYDTLGMALCCISRQFTLPGCIISSSVLL
jgi:hypothetical protein